MKTAGGVISIIAGLLGICAAIITLFVGGVSSALESDGAGTVIGLGWGGILFSFLIIIFGALAIKAKTRKPAILLIISAVLGAILGGTFVAVCMALALVGGILAAIPAPAGQGVAPSVASATTAQTGRKPKKALIWAGGILGFLVLIAVMSPDSDNETGQPVQPAQETPSKAKKPAATPKTGPLTAEVGTPVTTGKFEITVTSVLLRDSVGDEFLASEPSEGGVYIAVQWRYKNISTKPIGSFSHPRLMLVDSNGTEYEADWGASSLYAGEADVDTKFLSDLNPGLTSSDADVFEISRESMNSLGWALRIDADRDIVVSLSQRSGS